MTNLWSAKTRIGPLCLQAGCPKRRLNLALVFCLFCVVVHCISFDWWMCAFVVLGLVFQYQAKRFAWGTSPKWPILCRVGRKTLTQSISLEQMDRDSVPTNPHSSGRCPAWGWGTPFSPSPLSIHFLIFCSISLFLFFLFSFALQIFLPFLPFLPE